MDLLPRGDLHNFGLKYNTDKAGRGHDYLRLYEFFFSRFRDDAFTLLELGVGPYHKIGASLYTWKAYFPKAHIVGVDIKMDAAKVAEERIAIELGDLGVVGYLDEIAAKYKPRVILDDASHHWSHQILALERLFFSLELGGIYIVEDLHTSFGELVPTYGKGQQQDAFSYMMTLTALVCGHGEPHSSFAKMPTTPMQQALAAEIDSITIYNHTAVILRKPVLGRAPRLVPLQGKGAAARPEEPSI